MKKGKTALQIVHNRPKQDKNNEESGASSPSLINPHDALLLFKQMLDQVKYLCSLELLSSFPEYVRVLICV